MHDPAVLGLAEALGVSPPLTTGCLVGVLTHLPDHARTGDLSGVSDLTLERWAQWPGKRGRFAAAFRAYLCDPQGVVRGWEKHNGAAMREAEQARERMREARKVRRTQAERSPNVRRTFDERALLRNGTERNITTEISDTAQISAQSTDPERANNSGDALRASPVSVKSTEAKPKAPKPVKWPDWPQPVRAKMHDRWRSRLGDVPYPQWVAALGPVFGNPPAPWTLAQMAEAYDSWLCSVAAGGPSSPFLRRNPSACASVLSAIAGINEASHPDDPERLAAIDRLVHGRAA
jgi:hypothetical protein